jgi:tetratricopeptide (TPR) repeat protein
MRRAPWLLTWLIPAVLWAQPQPGERARPAAEPPSLIPKKIELSKAVRAAVDDKVLSEAERRRLRLFHGLWEELSEEDRRSAEFLLASWKLTDPLLSDAQTAAMIRGEAALLRGEAAKAIEILSGDDSPAARLLRGRAHADLGRHAEAIAALEPLREALKQKKPASPAEWTAGFEAVAMLATLEGKPAADYQMVMDGLGAVHQQMDRLHWPALLAQARLLLDKDNPEDAVVALRETLRLNPRCSEAWYLLGRVGLSGYDFTAVGDALGKLRQIEPDHVLAAALEAEMGLLQRDAAAAERVAEQALRLYPGHRHLNACAIAARALRYDGEGAQRLFEQYNKISPGNPLALYLTGKYMSLARQYDGAEQLLNGAAALMPSWPAAHIELGLLLNQAGKEDQALEALRTATALDPFNKRAANTMKMLDALAGYQKLETEHFIIKYRDPIDGALAADMPEVLERIHADVTGVFGHKPRRKTLIEIMPDKRWFAIRITGMPFIWTIGASTGPVIALTPPREGSHHAGPYDWARVIRHEFTHTVTLDQTANRIPHWFTEAAAVAQEPGPRDYETAQMLAKALADDELFNLESINWAFVRPKKKTDRALAYGQSHWMYEYLTARFGHRAVLKALQLCRQGVAQSQIIPQATGQTADEFLADFKHWAGRQVQSWGLAPQPPGEQIMRQIKEAGTEKVGEKVDELLKKHPDHPDLLELAAHAAVESGLEDAAVYALLLRYAAARPIDPWADRELAAVALRLNQPQAALAHLEQLDRLDQSNGDHAAELARLYQQLQQHEEASSAAERALHRQPYDPKLRETAATMALQAGRPDTALRHLKALTLIEPDRPLHFTRLAALHHKLGHADDARAAAQAARKLDPLAPVDVFLP